MKPETYTEPETYSESAKGIVITRERAVQELAAHGLDTADMDEFFIETGDHSHYNASTVLDWLGY